MDSVEWKTTDELVDYASAVSAMEARVAAIRAGAARELAWLVEHPPLYTRGTSADTSEFGRAGALSGARDRPRRTLHLSWPGPAAWPT